MKRETVAYRRARLPLLALAVAMLLVGGWGGLLRMGWAWQPRIDDALGYHGPLVAIGAVATLIAVERAVVIRRWWSMSAPALALLSTEALVHLPELPAGALVVAAGLALAATCAEFYRRFPMVSPVLMGIGALTWAASGVLWAAGYGIATLVPFWIVFLSLTILSERLELVRTLRPSGLDSIALVLSVGVQLVGAGVAVADRSPGLAILGAGLLFTAVWMGPRDRPGGAGPRPPLTRYIAVAVRLAYVWLAVAGLLLVLNDGGMSGPRNDAMLHAFFVGFVMGMIFAHGPIILPGVLGRTVGYRALLYVPLAALSGATAVRVAADLAGLADLARWGGLVSALAIPAFFLTMASTARSRRGVPEGTKGP